MSGSAPKSPFKPLSKVLLELERQARRSYRLARARGVMGSNYYHGLLYAYTNARKLAEARERG